MTITYSSKAAARKGAIRKGIDLNTIEFIDNIGRWSWEVKSEKVAEPVVEPVVEPEPIIETPKTKKSYEKNIADAARKPKPAPSAPKVRDEKNGILRPSVGGKCRAIWDACDQFRTDTKRIPMPKDMKVLAEANGWNSNNAVIEMYQWRKYEGLIGRKK